MPSFAPDPFVYLRQRAIRGGGSGGAVVPVPPAETIGGVAIGSAGTGIQSGYRLIGGDDYGGALDAITPAAPFGKYGTTRAYLLPTSANGPRGAVGGLSLKGYDTDPFHTGHNDTNRGNVRPSWSDSMVQASSVLKLKARAASTAEKALFNPELNVNNIMSMIHTAGSLVFRAPFFIEWRAKLTKAQAAMGGLHPSLWLMQMDPPRSGNGLEIDWEGESFRIEPNYFVWSGGSSSASKGTPVTTVYDNQFHTFALEVTPTTLRWYYDGVLSREATYSLAFPNKPFYALMTAHVAAFASDPYVDSEWVAAGDTGASIELDWFRLWTQPEAPARAPSIAPVNYEAASGVPFSFTLPTSTEVWGSEISEKVEGFISESNSPGGNYSGAFAGWPVGISYNTTTRVLSGTSTEPGTLHIVRYPVDGGSAKPHRMALHVGPKFPASITVPVGGSLDLYLLAECGQLTSDTAGVRAKTITASIPGGSGLTFTGDILSATTAGTYSLPITVTNSRGQQATVTVSVTAGTPASDFMLDTFTEAVQTPLASHVGELGATWTGVTLSNIDEMRVSTAGRLFLQTASGGYGRTTTVAPSANYYVEGVVSFLTAVAGEAGAGIAGRVSSSQQTMYFARYGEAVGAWQLFSIVNGTVAPLATAATSPRPTVDTTVRLTMNGTTISVSVEGVEVISVTNSAIAGPGYPGIRFSTAATTTTGQHLNRLSARAL